MSFASTLTVTGTPAHVDALSATAVGAVLNSVVDADPLLFPGDGSLLTETIVAVFVVVVWPAATVACTEMVALALRARPLIAHDNPFPLIVHEPWLGVADTRLTSDGSVSLT